jgi:hypothetical protein
MGIVVESSIPIPQALKQYCSKICSAMDSVSAKFWKKNRTTLCRCALSKVCYCYLSKIEILQQYDEKDIQQSAEEFYNDIRPEFEKFGRILTLKVTRLFIISLLAYFFFFFSCLMKDLPKHCSSSSRKRVRSIRDTRICFGMFSRIEWTLLCREAAVS